MKIQHIRVYEINQAGLSVQVNEDTNEISLLCYGAKFSLSSEEWTELRSVTNRLFPELDEHQFELNQQEAMGASYSPF